MVCTSMVGNLKRVSIRNEIFIRRDLTILNSIRVNMCIHNITLKHFYFEYFLFIHSTSARRKPLIISQFTMQCFLGVVSIINDVFKCFFFNLSELSIISEVVIRYTAFIDTNWGKFFPHAFQIVLLFIVRRVGLFTKMSRHQTTLHHYYMHNSFSYLDSAFMDE